MRAIMFCFLIILAPAAAPGQQPEPSQARVPPQVRTGEIPPTRWDHRAEAALWTRSALAALKTHGKALVDIVPRDIGDWCPGYAAAPPARRRAFWVGFLSALAKHESTWRPRAVGGGGRWFGLLQILPATARGHGCAARSGPALLRGPASLSCAIRIMARTVPRDGVVALGGRGVAADWGPLASPAKRREMMGWTRAQSYCRTLSQTRPRARPERRLPPRPKLRPAGLGKW